MSNTPKTPDQTISESLAPVISAVAERIHYAESRRTNYTVMAAALIAAGLTVITFAAGSITEEWLRDAAVAASMSVIITGLWILYAYGVQTNRYPYTSATKTWKWFYRDALPNQSAFDLNRWQRWKNQVERVRKAYTDQLPDFKLRLRALQADGTNADQDMEQLYSLHINEKYKNIYLSDLRTLFNRGLICTVLFTVLGGLFGLCQQNRNARPAHNHIANAMWEETIDYRPISSSLADRSDIIAKVVIVNHSKVKLTIRKLLVHAQDGWILPAQLTYSERLPAVLAPQDSETFFADILMTKDAYGEISSIDTDIQ